MKRGHRFWLAPLTLLLTAQVVLAAQSTVVLAVEGMT
jgi:hypothetical protein